MNHLIIKLVENQEELDQTIKVRKKVFIEEQNVPYKIEINGLDLESEHFIVYLDEEPIGCARLRTIDGIAKLERIAILKKYRKKGFGTKLTFFLINYCKKKEFKKIILDSQSYISNFYKKIGFKNKGSAFIEAGIEHIEMFLDIS